MGLGRCLVTTGGVDLWVAAYSDDHGVFLADAELVEVAAALRDGLPRPSRRRAGGWQVERAAVRPSVLPRVVIADEMHYLVGDAWRWTVRCLPARRPGGGRR